jgi:ubiquinone/menaquinone biosynthesis C-methylase UbiE
VRADVERLPFATGSFAAVVACRLLHHVHEHDELTRLLRELVRVSAGPVLVTFWNRASLPGLRRRLGLARDEGPNGRVARTTEELRTAAEEAGAALVEVRHVLPWLSQQSFAVLMRAGAKA